MRASRVASIRHIFSSKVCYHLPLREMTAAFYTSMLHCIEFPQRLLHLLRNTSYLLFVACCVCSTYAIMGVFANMVRYLEIAFLQQASVANIIAGFLLEDIFEKYRQLELRTSCP